MSITVLNPCLDCGAIPEMKTVCPGDEPPIAWCQCACGRRGESYNSLEEAAQFWNDLNPRSQVNVLVKDLSNVYQLAQDVILSSESGSVYLLQEKLAELEVALYEAGWKRMEQTPNE